MTKKRHENMPKAEIEDRMFEIAVAKGVDLQDPLTLVSATREDQKTWQEIRREAVLSLIQDEEQK